MRQKQAKGGGGTLAIVALVAFTAGRLTAEDKPVASQPQSFVAQPAAAEEPISSITAAPADEMTEMSSGPFEPSEAVEVSPRRPYVASPNYDAGDVESVETDVYYRNCSAARAAGAAPIHDGEPGYAYHLDRDRDGVACE